MHIKINYFTSTGNTLWVVNKIRDYFEKNHHKVDVYDSTLCGDECFMDCDIIGFVYPVWGSTMPNPQRSILKRMNNGKQKKVFFLGNAGVFSGDTGIYYKKIANSKGYDTVYVDHIFLPINSIYPGFSFFRQPSKKKTAKMLDKATKKLLAICKNIENGIRVYRGRGPLALIGGKGQRDNYDLLVGNFKSTMSINNTTCLNCNLCYSICPVNAITMEEDKYMIDHDRCIFCLKCYNYCPNASLMIGEDSHDTEKYSRYKGLNKKFNPIKYR